MRCISSVTYKIKVNGVMTKNITPMRGLDRETLSLRICFLFVQKASRRS
jgi:hypothetical protein